MRSIFLVTLAVSSLAFAPPAATHTKLVSSEPAANSYASTAPHRIRLVYSEPVEGSLARVSLSPAGGSAIVLRASADPRDVHAVIALVDTLAPGRYKVEWRIVSADGHPVDGTFSFAFGDTTLGTPPAPADSAPEPVVEPEPAMEDDVWGPSIYGAPLAPALFRGAGLGALMAAAGVLLLLVLSGPNGAQVGDARVSRTITVGSVSALLLLAGHVVTWLINTSPDHTLDSAWAASAMSTSIGKIELWRVGLTALAVWAWWIARRPRLALAFAAAALAVSGAAGHSAAIQPLVSVPAKSIHLLAGGVWLGGLLWLIRRPDCDTPILCATDAARVSSLAFIAVIAVALSGVVQTLLFLPSLGDLVTSAYGWFALAKTAGLVALVGFGAYHRQRAVPRVTASLSEVDAALLRSSVRREIIVMTVVVLLGGVLAYVPPPGEDAAMPSHPSESTS